MCAYNLNLGNEMLTLKSFESSRGDARERDNTSTSVVSARLVPAVVPATAMPVESFWKSPTVAVVGVVLAHY